MSLPDFRPRWTKPNLTWAVHQTPKGIDPQAFIDEMTWALASWFQYIPTKTITRVAGGSAADMNIYVGPIHVFPGAGSQCVSTYPGAGQDFPVSTTWNEDITFGGIDQEFRYVCIHEPGHWLGLPHSQVPGTVMYAGGGWVTVLQQHDDVERIQALYLGPPPENHLVACPVWGSVTRIVLDRKTVYP